MLANQDEHWNCHKSIEVYWRNFRFCTHFFFIFFDISSTSITNIYIYLTNTTCSIDNHYFCAYHPMKKEMREKENGKFNNKPHKLNLCFLSVCTCITISYLRFIVWTTTEMWEENKIHWNECFDDDFFLFSLLEWWETYLLKKLDRRERTSTCTHVDIFFWSIWHEFSTKNWDFFST